MVKRPAKRHSVVAVVGEGVTEFELACALEVFGYERPEIMSPWYRFQIAAAEPRVRTELGLFIEPVSLDAVRRADTVIAMPVPRAVAQSDALVDAVRGAHERGARLLSLCTGAFVLAAAGVLDGRRATTHWRHAEDLARMYPEIKVDPDVLYVDDGDVMTSAGTAASIDLCLHVVRLDHGAEVANAIARRMVVPPHRDGGQAQYIDHPVASTDDGGAPLAAVLGWALERLDESLSVEILAERAAMSPRTFARRFRSVTGTTPHQWLVSQRVLLAQRILETTDDAVELVAQRCGFGTAAGLRVHFQRAVGIAPLTYRRTFRSEATR